MPIAIQERRTPSLKKCCYVPSEHIVGKRHIIQQQKETIRWDDLFLLITFLLIWIKLAFLQFYLLLESLFCEYVLLWV